MGVLSKAFGFAQGDFWPQDYRVGIDDMAMIPGRGIVSTVTPDSAYGLPAFLAVVHVLSEDMAKLPLKVFRNLKPIGKEEAPEHPLYKLLHDSPNPEMTSFTWRETSMGHLLTWGNCYSEIVRNGLGEVVELWPLRPDRVQVVRGDNGKRIYRYRPGIGDYIDLPPEKVFHIPGLGYDGYVGYSPVTMLRRAIGLGLAAQTYGEQMWTNGARPGLILTVPREVKMDDETATKLRNQVNAAHAGLSNAQRTMVLKDGISFQEVGIPPEDAQYIETRKFQMEEIARVFRIPLHKVGDLDRSTNNNIEQQALEYVQDALGGYIARWESQIQMDLIPEDDYFARFNLDSLLRADSVSRANSLHLQRIDGIINADEWRDIENRNPIPDGGGEAYWQPLNETAVGDVLPAAEPEQLRTVGSENPAAPGTVPLVPTAPSRNGHNGHTDLDGFLAKQGVQQERFLTTFATSIASLAKALATQHPPTLAEGAVKVDVHPAPVTIAEGAVKVTVEPPQVTLNVPESKPVTKSVKRDTTGRITEIVEA